MTTANHWELQEFRVRYVASFPAGFTDGNNAAWAVGTATKIKTNLVVNLDSIVQPRLRSPETRTRRRANPLGIIGRRTGTLDLLLPFNSDGGTGENAAKEFLEKTLLGISTPTAFSAVLDTGGHTTSNLISAGIGAKLAPGSAVLCGTRGDLKGNGEVKPVFAEDVNDIDLSMQTLGAMANDDVIWLSHTVFPDEAGTVGYIEVLLIGADGRQLNAIGCQVSALGVQNLGIMTDEQPALNFTIQPATWRWEGEPNGTKATMDKTTAPSGPDPVQSKGVGGFFIGPNGLAATQPRTFLHGGEWTIDPAFGYVPVNSPTGQLTDTPITDWIQAVGESKWTMTAIRGIGTPAPETYSNEFDSGTKHQVIFQIGAEAGNCVAIELPGTFLDERPRAKELEGQGAVAMSGHGEEFSTGSNSALQKADIRFHFFHAS